MLATGSTGTDLDLAPRCCRYGSVGYLERADIVQEGQVGLLLAARRYDPERGPFRVYAASRVIGSMRDAVRRVLRQGLAESLNEDTAVVPQRDVCELALLSIDAKRLAAAMRLMPKRSRIILHAMYWHGWTEDEVGKALGIGDSRVSHIHLSALSSLRVLLA